MCEAWRRLGKNKHGIHVCCRLCIDFWCRSEVFFWSSILSLRAQSHNLFHQENSLFFFQATGNTASEGMGSLNLWPKTVPFGLFRQEAVRPDAPPSHLDKRHRDCAAPPIWNWQQHTKGNHCCVAWEFRLQKNIHGSISIDWLSFNLNTALDVPWYKTVQWDCRRIFYCAGKIVQDFPVLLGTSCLHTAPELFVWRDTTTHLLPIISPSADTPVLPEWKTLLFLPICLTFTSINCMCLFLARITLSTMQYPFVVFVSNKPKKKMLAEIFIFNASPFRLFCAPTNWINVCYTWSQLILPANMVCFSSYTRECHWVGCQGKTSCLCIYQKKFCPRIHFGTSTCNNWEHEIQSKKKKKKRNRLQKSDISGCFKKLEQQEMDVRCLTFRHRWTLKLWCPEHSKIKRRVFLSPALTHWRESTYLCVHEFKMRLTQSYTFPIFTGAHVFWHSTGFGFGTRPAIPHFFVFAHWNCKVIL